LSPSNFIFFYPKRKYFLNYVGFVSNPGSAMDPVIVLISCSCFKACQRIKFSGIAHH
jgi:hypothetical protein